MEFLSKIKCAIGFHKIISFKHCNKYLVAGYCKNCCTIKVGNPRYGDGSYYQKTLKEADAIKFVDKDIAYITKYEYANDYETLENLEFIKIKLWEKKRLAN